MSTNGTVIETGTSMREPQRKKSLLFQRNFLWLTSGQAISNMGDLVYSTTLLIWVYSLNGSAVEVSGVLIAEYGPILLLGPLAGVFVDRWHRLRIMLTSDLTRTVIALLPILVPGNVRLPAIYVSVFLISAIGRLFMPALAGVRQVIVAEEEQGQAASINQVTQALALIIGPALASPLYFTVGPVGAVLLNAGSYAASAFCLWRMRVPGADLLPSRQQKTAGTTEGTKAPGGVRTILREMREGLAFTLKTRVLVVLFLLGIVGMFGAGSINALEIVFVSQRLHANPNLYGYLMAIGGMGMLVGAICAGLIAKRIQARHMAAGSMLAIGIGLSMYTLQTSFGPVVVMLAFLFSMPQGMLNVGIAPLLMKATPRHLMGRVQSLFTTLNFAASLLAIVLSGYLGSFVPVYLLLFGSSVLIALAGIIGLIALPAPAQA